MMKKLLLIIFILLSTIFTKAQIVKLSNEVSKIKEDTYVVRIQIERGSLDKDILTLWPSHLTFFQISYNIPNNLHVIGLDAHGGYFDFTNGVMTYTWYDLPKEDLIEVTFKSKNVSEQFDPVELTGTYYYLVDEEKQIFNLPKIILE